MVFCQKNAVLNRIKMCLVRMFVLRLAAIQRNWSPAALFNDQIHLGGDQRWRCDKVVVVTLQLSGKLQNVFISYSAEKEA